MPTPQRPGSLWFVGAATAVLMVGVLTMLPNSPEPASQTGPPAPLTLQVHLDPETGEMVPFASTDKAALDQAARRRLSRSAAGLREVRDPDGGYHMDLAGRFQSLSLATVDSNGALHTGCVTNEQQLDRFLDHGNAPRESDEE